VYDRRGFFSALKFGTGLAGSPGWHFFRRDTMASSWRLLFPAVLFSQFPVLAAGVGLDTGEFDAAIRPQDNLYQYVNHKWIARTEIPADKAVWGAFTELREKTHQQVKELLEAAAADTSAADPEKRKLGDLYRSFMDEARVDSLGAKPIAAELARIDAVTDYAALPALFAHWSRVGVDVPFDINVHQDNRDATKYIVDLVQAGLGLPDRDYYLKDDAKLKDVRTKYQAHIARMLAMAGESDAAAAADAASILAFETRMAQAQWTKVENRDPIKTYNKTELTALPQLMPHYDWKRYLADAGISGHATYLIVSQPSYLKKLAAITSDTPLPVWRAYLRSTLLRAYAPYLSKPWVDANFAFYGTVISGVPTDEQRWERGVGFVEGAMGEGIGQLYVAKYFPPANKARMEALVGALLATYKSSIDQLDWMGPQTKVQAQAKLAKFTPKIGYPKRWRDYTRLEARADDLLGNLMRANAFEYQRNIDKLGKPIDRDEWGMTPQTINAYYNPELNEIVFPAAILQPPFFDAKADDAVNYGAIGMVIGHEISHGFDDQGSQYDGDGNLHDWWTAEDHERFKAKTQALVAQYSAYEPVPGFKINGELTLGENIADNSGLAIAYKAYHLSLGGKSAPVIGGVAGDQRFFLSLAQAWRSKVREAEAIRRVKVDPHSPPEFRVLGSVTNQDPFFEAFGVKPTDRMYRTPAQRVHIW
jgi:putative endopeptidase